MNNRDKEVIRQLTEKGVDFEDLSEWLNNFPEPSSAKDIEDKLAKLINPQPLFTLTAEEVDIVEVVFNRFILDMPDLKKFIIEHNKEFQVINNLINRIKQWKVRI